MALLTLRAPQVARSTNYLPTLYSRMLPASTSTCRELSMFSGDRNPHHSPTGKAPIGTSRWTQAPQYPPIETPDARIAISDVPIRYYSQSNSNAAASMDEGPQTGKSQITTTYNAADTVASYTAGRAPIHMDYISEQLGIEKGDVVVELGGGSGNYSKEILKRHPELAAFVHVDYSLAMQDKFRDRIASLPQDTQEKVYTMGGATEGDVREIKTHLMQQLETLKQDGKWDGERPIKVVTCQMMHHLTKQEQIQLLKDLNDSLPAGSKVVISLSTTAQITKGFPWAHFQTCQDGGIAKHAVTRFFTESDLRQHLSDNGATHISFQRCTETLQRDTHDGRPTEEVPYPVSNLSLVTRKGYRDLDSGWQVVGEGQLQRLSQAPRPDKSDWKQSFYDRLVILESKRSYLPEDQFEASRIEIREEYLTQLLTHDIEGYGEWADDIFERFSEEATIHGNSMTVSFIVAAAAA